MALKVMTIVGTRPEIIKLSRILEELNKFSDSGEDDTDSTSHSFL